MRIYYNVACAWFSTFPSLYIFLSPYILIKINLNYLPLKLANLGTFVSLPASLKSSRSLRYFSTSSILPLFVDLVLLDPLLDVEGCGLNGGMNLFRPDDEVDGLAVEGLVEVDGLGVEENCGTGSSSISMFSMSG